MQKTTVIMKIVKFFLNELSVVEVRISPSEIRSTPMRFNPCNGSSSQITVTRVISGDDVATTGRDSDVTHTTLTSEEAEGTNGRVSIRVSVSFRSGLPMDEGSVEATSRATVDPTNKMVAQSSVISVVAVGQVSLSKSDGLSAGSGVGETTRAVSTWRSGSRGVTACGVASSTSGDEGTGNVSSLRRNMVPHVSSARVTTDTFTSNLAINVEFSTGAKRANEAAVGGGARTDIEGVRSSVCLGSTTSRSTLTTSRDESTADVSAPGGNVIPGAGSTRKARDSITTKLAINIELSTRGNGSKDVGVGIGGTSDVKGVRSRVSSSAEAQDWAHRERDS
jgi:hypothetical protein